MSELTTIEGDIVRPMTDDEIVVYQAACAAAAAAEQAAADALEARKAPLRRLGLTEDEINTVLGL